MNAQNSFTCHPEPLFWAKDLRECVGPILLFRGTFTMQPRFLAKEPGWRVQDLHISGDPSSKRAAQDDRLYKHAATTE
jgi:hypothetical protein